MDQQSYAIPRNREILGKYVDKIQHITPEQKNELKELVNKLNGQEGPFKLFLEKLKHTTGDATIDEVNEVNKIAREGVAAATIPTVAVKPPTSNVITSIGGTSVNLDIKVTEN